MPLVQPTVNFNFLITMWDHSDSNTLNALSALANIAGQMALGGFSEITGLNTEMELETYQEGGNNAHPHKFFKYAKYPNIVCKRGVTFSTDLADWYNAVVNHLGAPPGPLGIPVGAALSAVASAFGDGPSSPPPQIVKKDGLIILFDRNGLGGISSVPGIGGLLRLPVAIWSFQGALPERLQGPALNAKGNEIAIETLELSHEGLSRVSLDIFGAVAGAAGAVAGAVSVSGSVSI